MPGLSLLGLEPRVVVYVVYAELHPLPQCINNFDQNEEDYPEDIRLFIFISLFFFAVVGVASESCTCLSK